MAAPHHQVGHLQEHLQEWRCVRIIGGYGTRIADGTRCLMRWSLHQLQQAHHPHHPQLAKACQGLHQTHQPHHRQSFHQSGQTGHLPRTMADLQWLQMADRSGHPPYTMAVPQWVQMADRSCPMPEAPMKSLTQHVHLMPAVLLGQSLLLGHLTELTMPHLKRVLEGYLPEMLQCPPAQMTAQMQHPLATQACRLSCRHLHLHRNHQLLPVLVRHRQHSSSQTEGLMMHCTSMTLQWALAIMVASMTLQRAMAIMVSIERWWTWDSRLPPRSSRWFDQIRFVKG